MEEGEKKNRGGKREGAGRKKGSISVPKEEKYICKQISMRPKEWDAIDSFCKSNGITRSKYIRTAVDLYRTQQESNSENNAEICILSGKEIRVSGRNR